MLKTERSVKQQGECGVYKFRFKAQWAVGGRERSPQTITTMVEALSFQEAWEEFLSGALGRSENHFWGFEVQLPESETFTDVDVTFVQGGHKCRIGPGCTLTKNLGGRHLMAVVQNRENVLRAEI